MITATPNDNAAVIARQVPTSKRFLETMILFTFGNPVVDRIVFVDRSKVTLHHKKCEIAPQGLVDTLFIVAGHAAPKACMDSELSGAGG